jgi:hypothetical protein
MTQDQMQAERTFAGCETRWELADRLCNELRRWAFASYYLPNGVQRERATGRCEAIEDILTSELGEEWDLVVNLWTEWAELGRAAWAAEQQQAQQ